MAVRHGVGGQEPTSREDNPSEGKPSTGEGQRRVRESRQAPRVYSGCSNKNTTDWVHYKQQKFTSHSSKGWEVQDQGVGRLGAWESLLTVWLADSCLFLVSSRVGGGEAALFGRFLVGH